MLLCCRCPSRKMFCTCGFDGPFFSHPDHSSAVGCLSACAVQEFLAYDEPEFVGVWPRATSCPPAASA